MRPKPKQKSGLFDFDNLPEFEDLIKFVKEGANHEGEIPVGMMIDLIALVEMSEKYETEFVMNNLIAGVGNAFEEIKAVEKIMQDKAIQKLQGSSSDFFFELLFSIVTEFNLIGRGIKLGGSFLQKTFAPVFTRAKITSILAQSSDGQILKAIQGNKTHLLEIGTKPLAFKKSLLERALDRVNDPANSDYIKGGSKALIKASKGKIKGKSVKGHDTFDGRGIDLSMSIQSILISQLETVRKSTINYYIFLKKLLKKHKEDPKYPSLTMDQFQLVFMQHHYRQGAAAKEIKDTISSIIKRVLWTFELKERNPFIAIPKKMNASATKTTLPLVRASSVSDKMIGWPVDRDWGRDIAVGGLTYVPSERIHNVDLLVAISQRIKIVFNQKLDSIVMHAKREFPAVDWNNDSREVAGMKSQKASDYVTQPKVPILEPPQEELDVELGEVTLNDIDYFPEFTKAQVRFMKVQLYRVLNNTNQLLNKHEFENMQWVMIRKIFPEN